MLHNWTDWLRLESFCRFVTTCCCCLWNNSLIRNRKQSRFSTLFENRNNLISIHRLINIIPLDASRNLYSSSSTRSAFKKPVFKELFCWKCTSRFPPFGKDVDIISRDCQICSWSAQLWWKVLVCHFRCSQAVCLRADIRVCANNQPVKVLSFYLSGWIYTHGFSST